MPCDLVNGVPRYGTVDLIVYYARNVSDSTQTQTVTQQIDSSTEAWRACIGTVTLLGANLTASEDVYNPTGDDINWNLGPNLQFYRFITWLLESDGIPWTPAMPFFYMEGDTVPRKQYVAPIYLLHSAVLLL